MFAKRAITLESKKYLPLCTCSNHSASILCMSTSDLLASRSETQVPENADILRLWHVFIMKRRAGKYSKNTL